MVLTFPTALFGFLDQEIDIERQTLKGGTALSGDEDKVSTDGGGRVFADFSSGALVDRDKVLAWRALATILEEGVTPIVVPFCDIRHQPYGGEHVVPHSDDTFFSDGSGYSGGGPVAHTAAGLALRATAATFSISLPQPLIGGEWFSMQHATKGWRAYKVRTVVSQDDDTVAITFRPPLREAVDEGQIVDFENPRCLMTADGRPGTRLINRRQNDAAVRFVEAP